MRTSMKREPTEELFLKNVSSHVMTIVRDDGVNRHIIFRNPKSFEYWFELITWRNCLCINGDMGTYVFSRLEDMFQFFRTDRLQPREGQTLFINLGYWAEKVQAQDKNSPIREYVEDLAKSLIVEYLKDCEASPLVIDAVEENVFPSLSDGDFEMHRVLGEFECEDGDDTFRFEDAWEMDFTDYSFHFHWCCYAIAWGIQQYDTLEKGVANDEQQ